MKNIFKIFLSLTIIAGILISCDNENINEKSSIFKSLSLENLKKDTRMQKYLSLNSKLVSGIIDINKVKELSSKENLNSVELEQLSISLGFDSFQDYRLYYNIQTNLLREIEKDYNITAYNETEIYKALFSEYTNYSAKGGPCEDSCWRTFRNCMGLTTTAALTAHAGCIALDPTIIGGIACHGIA